MSVERGSEVSTSYPDRSRPGVAGEQLFSGEPSTPGAVEVRANAEATQLSVMRAVIGDLAMRADFDVDSIADLRLAVDEACSSLIRLTTPEAVLVCRFHSTPDSLAIQAEVSSNEAAGPRTDTFSWRVLTALMDSVHTSVDLASDGHAGRHLVRIDLSKQRMVRD